MEKNSKWYSSMVVRKEPLLIELDEADKVEKERNYKIAGVPLRKKPADFPTVSEPVLMRHYHRLARWNYSWDDGLYPLGSCTMKYNPVINENIASDSSFVSLHPALPDEATQGALEIIWDVQNMLSQIIDLPGLSLTPAAGAHGELAGVFMMKKYFEKKGQKRTKVLVPDSAHGTNPASAAMAGYSIVNVPSNSSGLTDLEALASLADEECAALMITNPNTLGLFETEIVKIKEILEKRGILLYMDGANLNAILDKVSFGKMGVDITQLNLHKTFSTPHGGGGPGQGAIGCSERLKDFLPSPLVEKNEQGEYRNITPANSIGPIKGWSGHFGNILRAWVYLKSYGNEIHKVAERAVLNANYMKKKLSPFLEKVGVSANMHEVVFNQKTLQAKGATTMNFAKALLDRGFYAPTVYFPLHVNGAIMVEPSESESKGEMDTFIAAVEDIFKELENSDQKITASPHNTFVKKIDEVGAARNPVLKW